MAAGDHLIVDRGGYTHHGVDVGDGTVIHFNGEPASKRDATIRRTSRWLFSRGNSVRVAARPASSFSAGDAVARAKASLDLDGYSLVGRNCEHFATWAVTGVPVSAQVEQLARHAAAALGRSVVTGDPAPLAGWAVWEFGLRLWRTLWERIEAATYTDRYGAFWQGDSWQGEDGRPYAFVRSLDWLTPNPNGLAPANKPMAGTLAFRLWMDPLRTVFASSPDDRFHLAGADGLIAIDDDEFPPQRRAPTPTLLRPQYGPFPTIERSGIPEQPTWPWGA